MNTPATKLSGVRAAMDVGDWREAIRLAAKFPDLGAERAAILDGWSAISNPSFCRQIGKDPEALIAAGRAALIRRYGRLLIVDGHEFDDDDSALMADGQFPPFVIFDADEQANIPGEFATRAEAEAAREALVRRYPSKESA